MYCISTHCTDTTSSNEYHSGHTGISGQESGREISAPEVKSDQPFMGEEVINTSTCSGPTMSCGSASGDMCDVVGSEDVTMKGEVMMGVTEAAEREEIMDEVVLPFELDLADTHDLLSLSEEIQHLLDPKVHICAQIPRVQHTNFMSLATPHIT